MKLIQKFTSLILSILALFVILHPHMAEAAEQKDVGIWFSTWNSNEAKYDWLTGYGLGATNTAVTDANNDGKADLFFYWDTPSPGFQGRLDIALSNGNGFNNPTTWIPTGSHRGANKYFFADINGDKNADIIQYFARNPQECTWVVALSNGNGTFGGFQIWAQGHGCGSYEQFVADVDGDEKADAVVFTNYNTNPAGIWYVAKSNGSGFFYTGSAWATNLGQGSGKRFLADVNGDGAADVVTFTNNAGNNVLGDWWSAQANGTNGTATAFVNTNRWSTGYGYGSDSQMVGDINADGKADAVVYYKVIGSEAGKWYKELSTGGGFAGTIDNKWKTDHGNWAKSKLRPAELVTLANVDGDKNAQGYGTADPVTFQDYYKNGLGAAKWRALTGGDKYDQPVQMNIWDAWEVTARPLVNNVPNVYDTNDISTTDAQIAQIDAAGINIMLFDLSNGVYDLTTNQGAHKWITQRAKTVCERIANYNASGHTMKFAVVGGAVQFSNPSNLGLVENEAQYVLNTFVNDSTCGPHYYNYNGKPLLGMYFTNTAQRDAWLTYPHSASNSFTVKYAEGDLPNLLESGLLGGGVPTYPSYTGAACGTVPTGANVKPGDYGNFLGWGLPYGTPGTGPIMVVQPGWYNKFNDVNGNDFSSTRKIARTIGGVSAGFYTNCAWSRALANKATTDLLIINSYNEYVEETAVAPTDTSNVPNSYPGAQWTSSDQYWNITVSNIASYKN
jgi:hypothetical protein